MANVKIFMAPKRPLAYWKKVARYLDVIDRYEDADVSLVLSGKNTNPVGFSGKKVLFYHVGEWMPKVPPPNGFEIFRPILEVYYDEMIDVSKMTEKKCAEIIERIRGEYV